VFVIRATEPPGSHAQAAVAPALMILMMIIYRIISLTGRLIIIFWPQDTQ